MHIRLRPAAETLVRSGHPWIFDQSIREQNREGAAGELAVVFDRKDQFLALGLYDPNSPIRLRIIHRGKPATINPEWWRARLRDSIARRATIFDASTTGGRWINGESDSFPGLVLDRYGETLVLKVYSTIWFDHLAPIVTLILEELSPSALVLRLSRNIAASARDHGFSDGQLLAGSLPPEAVVQFSESGLSFEADVLRGQKTGFFLDQRENRRIVGSLASGKRVLNAFSFSGGFSLYAARGGARSVTDIDISAHALESSRRNFELNKSVTSNCHHQRVQADVFEWLAQTRPERYELVILDPPSLAKRQSDKAAALKAYSALAGSGFALAAARAVTVCCSCSAHIRADEFFATVTQVARATGRPVEVLRQTREPVDHHATFPEGEYLKAIYFQFD